MILSGSSISLQAVLAGAVATSQPECHVDYIDYAKDGVPTTPATSRSALNSTTDVSILTAPTFNPTREVLNASIYNKDTASVTVTVKTDDGTTERIIAKATLLTLETFCYEKGQGWYALDANGNRKEVTGSVFSSLTVTGNETVGGTLTVTGALTAATGDFSIATNGYARIHGSGTPSSATLYWKTNTVDRWNMAVPSGATTLVLTDASSNAILTATQATGIAITGTLGVSGTIKAGGYTVGTLPANAAGLVAYVTDQLTAPAAKGAAPTGGGAITCYVMNTGAGWVGI